MAALAHEAAWLKGPFHGTSPSISVRRLFAGRIGRRIPHAF